MSGSAQSRRKSAPSKNALYRGVKLQRPAAQSQFTLAQIKKAVEDAIAKNAEAIAKAG